MQLHYRVCQPDNKTLTLFLIVNASGRCRGSLTSGLPVQKVVMSDSDRTHLWSRFGSTTILFVILGGAYLGGLYIIGGRVVFERGLRRLAMPAGVVGMLLTFLCLQMRDRKSSPLFCVSALAWVTFMVFANGQVAQLLVNRLESDFLNMKPLEEKEPFEAIIVLGGGCSQGYNGETQVNGGGERIVLAAKMYHSGLAKKLVCTGKRIEEIEPEGKNPADQYVRVLLQLNVPASAIETVGGINTAEEFRNLGARFKPEQRVGLITSAWHLGRAMRLARANGMEVQPLPAGFRSIEQKRQTLAGIMLDLIPGDEAMATNAGSIREYLAALVGR